MSVFVCPSLYLEMWLSNWNGVCTKRCVIFRRCAAYRFWWDNWAIILIRSDLPLAFLLSHPRMLFLCGENGLFIANVSERWESHEAYLDDRVGSACDFMVNVIKIGRFVSSILFLHFYGWKRGLKCFAKSLKSFRKWHQWDNWMMTKKYFKWLIEVF